MKKHLYFKIFIIVFFVFYTAVAIYGNNTSPKKEIFPVFSWSLFSYVSDSRKQVELEIIEIDQVALRQPTYFYDLRHDFRAARNRDVTLAKLLNRIANARSSDDTETVESLRHVLEQTYLRDHRQVAYRLVLTKFNPIERWRDGTIRSKQELARFEVLFE